MFFSVFLAKKLLASWVNSGTFPPQTLGETDVTLPQTLDSMTCDAVGVLCFAGLRSLSKSCRRCLYNCLSIFKTMTAKDNNLRKLVCSSRPKLFRHKSSSAWRKWTVVILTRPCCSACPRNTRSATKWSERNTRSRTASTRRAGAASRPASPRPPSELPRDTRGRRCLWIFCSGVCGTLKGSCAERLWLSLGQNC